MATTKPDNPVENFVYKTDGGAQITLRTFARIPAGVFRKTRSMDDMEQMFALIEAGVLSDDDLAAVDDLPVEELGRMFEGWSEAAGADLPK